MRLPTYFISHGGGPWPWMDEMRAKMGGLERALREMPREIGVDPAAVLMVSAHWEEPVVSVMASPRPGMLYDYYGFPPHTYKVVYPAPGAPALAERVVALIQAAGRPARLDAERGFDHGAFVPLALMYPEAQVPVVQLSLKQGLDPAEHIALGRALAPLRDEGVLIVGSGLSYHNLRAFGPQGREPSRAFDQWLQDTMAGSDPVQREAQLVNWTAAPAARAAHPREEHLIPLMVASGAAADELAACNYREEWPMGLVVSNFRFGALPAAR